MVKSISIIQAIRFVLPGNDCDRGALQTKKKQNNYHERNC